MNVPLPLAGGVEGGVSIFLASLAVGVTAAPKGFGSSGCGLLGGDFETGGTGKPVLLAGGFVLEVNFELMLDIHEFRRPIGAALGSFWFLGELGPGSTFSEFAR